MWFKCKKCGFIFSRVSEPDRCVDCGAEYLEGAVSLVKGEGIGELIDARIKSDATATIIVTSAVSGVLDIGEAVWDGTCTIVGGAVAGVTWLVYDSWSGDTVSGDMMESVLDQAAYDAVGSLNEWFYEETFIGKTINENSLLKYDSQGAQGIRVITETVGKMALATALTVVTGGAAAPLLGAIYGIGNSTERYAQSVLENYGEYDYLTFAKEATVGALSGAAEFWGYGKMGAGLYEAVSNVGLKNAAIMIKNNRTLNHGKAFWKALGSNLADGDNLKDLA